MLLTDKQVAFIRRGGSVLGLGFLLFYLFGWVTAVQGAEIYREIIGCSMIAIILAAAIMTDLIQHQQNAGTSKK